MTRGFGRASFFLRNFVQARTLPKSFIIRGCKPAIPTAALA